jgi:peptidoglycan/xylan/chitin deacetylase (PgdA/CDA1 family)
VSTKPPAPQAISALLKRAGFKRAEKTPYSVMGVRQYSDGFHVRAAPGRPGGVKVTWWAPPYGAHDALMTNAEMLLAYGDTLAEAGWSVQTWAYKIVVTAGTTSAQIGEKPDA